MGPLAKKLVAAPTARVEGRSWHGKYFAPLIQRAMRGNQRSGLNGALDHHHAATEAGDDAFAARKVPGLWHHAARPLRQQQAGSRDRLMQGFSLRRVGVAAHT